MLYQIWRSQLLFIIIIIIIIYFIFVQVYKIDKLISTN